MSPGAQPADRPSPRIQIEGGPSFSAGPGEDALLRAAVRAGVDWPYECSVGGCGACRFELLEGEVEDLWPEAPGLSARERSRGKRLACQVRPLSDLRVKVRCDESLHARILPQRRVAELVESRALTPDLFELSFRVEGPAHFLPGQYALLYLPQVKGARAYSMSNTANDEGLWQFIVRRVPGGHGSTALCDGLRAGHCITLDGPYGHAYLRDPGEREVICIAGGSGLGPMVSIARAALTVPGARPVRLFLGVRSQADLGCLDVLRPLEAAGLALSTVLSTPDAGWNGTSGFVHEEVARSVAADLDRYEYYFAGPPPMVDALQQLLLVERRVPFGLIHFDRFV